MALTLCGFRFVPVAFSPMNFVILDPSPSEKKRTERQENCRHKTPQLSRLLPFSKLKLFFLSVFSSFWEQPELHRDRIYGAHIAEYMEYLTEEDETKYKEHFAAYIENDITFDDVEEMYKVRARIPLYSVPLYRMPGLSSYPMYAFAGYAKLARVGGQAGAPHTTEWQFCPKSNISRNMHAQH